MKNWQTGKELQHQVQAPLNLHLRKGGLLEMLSGDWKLALML
jgi:hypothetical protein